MRTLTDTREHTVLTRTHAETRDKRGHTGTTRTLEDIPGHTWIHAITGEHTRTPADIHWTHADTRVKCGHARSHTYEHTRTLTDTRNSNTYGHTW